MSRKITVTKTEVLDHWSPADIVHAHALLDELEFAEWEASRKVGK